MDRTNQLSLQIEPSDEQQSTQKSQQHVGLESMSTNDLNKYAGMALNQLSTFEEHVDGMEWQISAALAGSPSSVGDTESTTTQQSLDKKIETINNTFDKLMFLFDQTARLHAGGDTLGPKTLQVRVSRCVAVSRGLLALCANVRERNTIRHDQLVVKMKEMMDGAYQLMKRCYSDVSRGGSSNRDNDEVEINLRQVSSTKEKDDHYDSNSDDLEINIHISKDGHEEDIDVNVQEVWDQIGSIQRAISRCEEMERRLDYMCERVSRSVESQRIVIADEDKKIDVNVILMDLKRTENNMKKANRRTALRNMVNGVLKRLEVGR